MNNKHWAVGVTGDIPRRIMHAYHLMVQARENCRIVTQRMGTPDMHRREYQLALAQTRAAIKLLATCTGFDSQLDFHFSVAASTAARNGLVALSDLRRVPQYLGVIDNDGAFGDQRLDVMDARRQLDAAIRTLGQTAC